MLCLNFERNRRLIRVSHGPSPSYNKLCIKTLLVLFFGYPIYLFVMMRLFLSLETMKNSGQLVCNIGDIGLFITSKFIKNIIWYSRSPVGTVFSVLDLYLLMKIAFCVTENCPLYKVTV